MFVPALSSDDGVKNENKNTLRISTKFNGFSSTPSFAWFQIFACISKELLQVSSIRTDHLVHLINLVHCESQ